MDIDYFKFSDYRRIAHNFLGKYGFLTKSSLPIDIELLIDKAGIEIIPVSMMYTDFGVKGAVLKKIGGYNIAIDETHYEEHEYYYRFTLAEELSHILLHEKFVASISSLDDVISFHQSFTDEDYKKIEQQARVLASQLLLPNQLFDDYVIKWVGENISELFTKSFYSKNDLAEYIADNLYKNLKLSKDVVMRSILRFPDCALDKVLLKYGQGLIQ